MLGSSRAQTRGSGHIKISEARGPVAKSQRGVNHDFTLLVKDTSSAKLGSYGMRTCKMQQGALRTQTCSEIGSE